MKAAIIKTLRLFLLFTVVFFNFRSAPFCIPSDDGNANAAERPPGGVDITHHDKTVRW